LLTFLQYLLFILCTTVPGTVNPCIVGTAGPGHYPRAKTRGDKVVSGSGFKSTVNTRTNFDPDSD